MLVKPVNIHNNNLNNENRQNNHQKKNFNVSFGGPLDGALTGTLAMLDTNPTANAVLLDLGSMVAPRSYIDGKRNKYAGFETFFREFASTFVTCLSAGIFAVGISKFANKMIDKSTNINTSSWLTKDGISTLENAWNNSDGNSKKYITNVLDNLSGQDGKDKKNFKDINWNKVEWFESDKWDKIHWKDNKYKGIQNNLKSRDGIINTLSDIMTDKNFDKKDAKNILKITEMRITNALGVNRDVEVNIGKNKFKTSLVNLLRDTYDMGKDVFSNNQKESNKIIKKITKINKVKAYGALALSSFIGLMSQHINRKITEKRTGKKGFVGTTDFNENIQQNLNEQNIHSNINKGVAFTNKKTDFVQDFYNVINKVDNKQSIVNNEPRTDNKQNKTKLLVQKIAASAGIIGLALGVMKVKSVKDFAKKLEFTGPVSTGNAVKTVYTSTLVGRFMASDDSTELRESACRDYLGFLNWLVLGGFAAKGTANLLDKNRKNLFNEVNSDKPKKGVLGNVKHWLNDVQLKTHSEIASKGKDFAKKNLWKLNVAHIAGLAYSTVMLGIALPLMNIIVTNHKMKKSKNVKNVNKNA